MASNPKWIAVDETKLFWRDRVDVKEEVRRLLTPAEFQLVETEAAKGLLSFNEIVEEMIGHQMPAQDYAYFLWSQRGGPLAL